MTCAKCQALEARIAELEADLEGAVYSTTDGHTKLAARLGLSVQQACVVEALHRRGKSPTPTWALIEMLELRRGGEYECGTANLISVTVANIRRRLGRDFVQSLYGSGYWLSDEARAEVADALR